MKVACIRLPIGSRKYTIVMITMDSGLFFMIPPQKRRLHFSQSLSSWIDSLSFYPPRPSNLSGSAILGFWKLSKWLSSCPRTAWLSAILPFSILPNSQISFFLLAYPATGDPYAAALSQLKSLRWPTIWTFTFLIITTSFRFGNSSKDTKPFWIMLNPCFRQSVASETQPVNEHTKPRQISPMVLWKCLSANKNPHHERVAWRKNLTTWRNLFYASNCLVTSAGFQVYGSNMCLCSPLDFSSLRDHSEINSQILRKWSQWAAGLLRML